VILVDTNLLVYAAIEDAPFHDRARIWLDDQLARSGRIGMPWHSLLGFIRLASNKRVYPTGYTVDDAWEAARRWLGSPNVWTPTPTERHADIISGLIASSKVRTEDVMDVHLAALAIEHGLTLCSADTDFDRYRGLRVLNPLAD